MSTEKVTSMQQSSLELPTNKGVRTSLASTGTTLPSSLPSNPIHQSRKNINENSPNQLENSLSTSTTESETNHSEPPSVTLDQVSSLKDVVGPLVNEVRDLKDSVQAKYSKLEGIITGQQQTINKLEATITTKQQESVLELTNQILCNTERLNTCLTENKILKKANETLKEHLTQIELAQLENNVIISGM